MDRRKSSYITVPLSVWCSGDLTLQEKAVLIEIDSQSDDSGVYSKTVPRLGIALGLPKKVVAETLASLLSKGAVTMEMAENGDMNITPHMDRRRYVPSGAAVTEPQQKTAERIDYDLVLAKWKEYNPSLQQPRAFNPKMQQQLRTLLKNNRSDLDELFKVFECVRCSDFLSGRAPRSEWKASLHWLIKDSNSSYQRILNGDFHRSESERSAFDRIFCAEQNQTDDYYK